MNINELIAEIEDSETFPPSYVVKSFVDRLLNCEIHSKQDTNLYLECLSELIEKLAENHDRVSPEQSKKVVKWASCNWFVDDLEYLDLLLTVLVNIDPEYSKPFLEEKALSTANFSSKKLILETLSEI